MKKTIELTPKVTKWIFLCNGVLNSLLGYYQLFIQTNSWAEWTSIIGLLLIAAGPLMIIYAALLFNGTNKLTPKVQIDGTEIIIKEDIHKRLKKIDWKEIEEITYNSYELSFQLSNNKTETVSLPTNAETSVEIKRTIRQYADERQIKVIGG